MRARMLALCALLVAVACATSPVVAGGLNPLVPSQVRQVLEQLGITSGGVYTAPALTPWTSAIDGGGYALTGVGALSATSATVTSTATYQSPRFSWSSASGKTLAATDCVGQCWVDDGATSTVPFVLPAAASGLRVSFYVSSGTPGGIKVTANGTDTIRCSATVSAAGGYVFSLTLGSGIVLEGQSGGWVARSAPSGLWSWDEATGLVGRSFTVGNGSLAAPAIRGSEANTGLLFGADLVTFGTSGVSRASISASGLAGNNLPLHGFTRLVSSPGTSSVANSHAGRVLANIGATSLVTLTLPAATAGQTYTFTCEDTDGIKVLCVGDDTISGFLSGTGGSITTSAAAGYAQSSVVGSTITFVAVSTTVWRIFSITGTWTIDS